MSRSIKRMKDNLAKSGALSPSGKKALPEEGMGCETALADAAETPAERPKKQEKHRPGKKIGAQRRLFVKGRPIVHITGLTHHPGKRRASAAREWESCAATVGYRGNACARNERVIGLVKFFHVLADQCRNCGKRFSLIAGIYNYGSAG